MTRWSLALAIVASLAVPLCAQEYSEAESWPPLESEGDLDESLDRQLDESLAGSMEDTRRRPPPSQEAENREWFVETVQEIHLSVEAFWLPVVGLHVSRGTRELDSEWNVDAKTGDGLMVRVSVGEEYVTLGLSGHVSHHEERKKDTRLDAYALYLDGQAGGALNEGPVEWVLFVGAGVGLAGFDFEDHFHDTVTAAGQIRLQTGVRFFEHVELLVNASWFHWGYPGHSIGNGGYLGIGLSLRF
jgi:hypothetical protein